VIEPTHVADSSIAYSGEQEGNQLLASPLENDSGVEDEISDELSNEIKHMKRRLRNVQESIQTSKSIADPTTWEQNCLNPVRNCIVEWRSIVVRYFQNSNEQLNGQIGKDMSLATFDLLQLAMQSGPLTGSNPGYFKRCGGDVAQAALRLLKSDVLATGDLSVTLLFTERQVDAIGKWKKNAVKAGENNKPPSKSMLKLQQGKSKARDKKERKTATTRRSRLT